MTSLAYSEEAVMITPTFSLDPIYAKLTAFATLENFWQLFDSVYGAEYDFASAEALRLQWANGDFSNLPPIEVVSGEVLGPALGGYAASLNKIYLSESFLATATAEQVVAVILEEIGHFVDAQLNAVDAPGDEGAIFSALVRGETLAESQLSALKTEDDTATVQLDGQVVQVERAGVVSSNPFYSYTIIANTSTLGLFTSIERGVSINDKGNVAFVADLDITDSKDNLYVSKGSEPLTDLNKNGIWDVNEPFTDTNSNGIWDKIPLTKFSSSGNIQPGVQINNQDQVIGSALSGTGISNVSLWDANNLGNPTGIVVAAGGGPSNYLLDLFGYILTGDPSDLALDLEQRYSFEQIFSYPSLNNSVSIPSNLYSGMAFSANTRNAFGSLGPVLAVPYRIGDISGNYTTPIKLPVYSVVADDGKVLVRLGNKGKTDANGPASPIVLFSNTLGVIPQSIVRAVSASDPVVSGWDYDKKVDLLMGFTELGQKPGISDDGQIVVFYGDLEDPSWLNTKQGQIKYVGSSSLQLPQLTRGPGIFASVAVKNAYRDKNFNNKFDVGESTVDRVIVRIAGKENGFNNFVPDSRVAVNSTHRDEDLNKNRILDTADCETM